jgi:hypothetical protein
MTAPKKIPNGLPVSFDQFRKQPVAAVAFCMLVAVGYMYFDLRTGYKEQIEQANAKIDALDKKIEIMQIKLKQSDSLLASAMTEIRIKETLNKL